MRDSAETLDEFCENNIEHIISSAHRSPERTKNYIKEAEEKGAQVLITAAGMPAYYH